MKITTNEMNEMLAKSNNAKFEGMITNKQEAIKMLCLTSKAWNYIAPELKKDSDVMMCYQPLGYVEVEIVEDVGPLDELGTDLYTEEGFVYSRDYGIVPSWSYEVPNFDYKRYREIQNEMDKNAASISTSKGGAKLMSTGLEWKSAFPKLVRECEYNDDSNSNIFENGEYIKVYDREVLKNMFGIGQESNSLGK